jgi:hypothetical protein
MGDYCEQLCHRRVGIGDCGSRSPMYRWHVDRRPARHRVRADRNAHTPLAWILAAMAMIIYAMALPERYDIACAAYAFTLMVTLAISGETSMSVLAARAWETLLGGLLGVAATKVILPLEKG